MTAISMTVGNVRPLMNCRTERAIVNEAMTVGMAVYIDGSTGDLPTIKKSVLTAVATGNVWGVVVSGPVARPGVTTLAAGDVVDVAVAGRVEGFSGATAGGIAYASDTAGGIADAAGTKVCVVGVMVTPTVLFVRPMLAAVSA